jgi:hypothetical protein
MKANYSAIPLAVLLIGFAIPGRAADAPAGGLVGHWKFDEPDGAKAIDSSGNGHDGVLHDAKRSVGWVGGAVECGQDALVEIPYAEQLDQFDAGITVSAWVKRSADNTWNTVVSREVKDGPSEYFGLAIVKNRALFSVDPDGAHYQNIKSDEDLPVGEWIHLAGTYNNFEFKLYVGGHLVKSAPCAIPFKFADRNPLIIGGNTNTQGRKWVDCFHGSLDEVRLYRRALTAEEIAESASRKP